MSLQVGRPRRTVREAIGTAARGLAVGVLSAGLAALVGYLLLTGPRAQPCGAGATCVQGFGPLMLAALAVPVIVLVAGPLLARLLRMPVPDAFAAPAVWVVVMVCVGLDQPADGRRRWPLAEPFSTIGVLLVLYVLVALLVTRRTRRG
ncbi:hypothetical protein [Catellatospora sp. IY07-71]|uniref:hypothetical protein n=1 Tax=Catellatospora sp. IY07-71 TaxID=2728827 RepID=UPI001BB3E167|nr:hypothetical protein [Catellatospora sp. IY07-71]